MIRRISPKAAIALALLPLTATLSAPALAATYRVSGDVSQTFASSTTILDSYDNTGFATTGNHANYDNFDPNNPQGNSYHASGVSLAGPTGLHAFGHAQALKQDLVGGTYNYNLSGGGAAYGTWTQFVISNPANPASTANVTSFINVHLDGADIVGSTFNAVGNTTGTTATNITFYVNGQNIGGGGYDASATNGGPVTYDRGGMLATFNGDAVLTTPTFVVQMNTPFTVEMILGASASVVASRDDQSFDLTANCDFGDTLTFATDRPVFNLPAGDTVNSPDAGIANNAFSIPEPAPLLSAAALPLLLLRRRRHA